MARLILAIALLYPLPLAAALPEPPQQHAPWQPVPVTAMPQYVPDLVAALFDAGLADPRGGVYREIELAIPQYKTRTTSTHGWYFSEGFAVCWDGLAHRVLRAGGGADLWQDVANSQGRFWREATVSAPPDAELVGVALLLRLGQAELAERLFTKLRDQRLRVSAFDDHDPTELKPREWFDYTAIAWLSGAFHEAVEAHATADDQLAVDISDFLLRVRPRCESARTQLPPSHSGDPQPFDFLDPVSTLRSDSQRRLSHPHSPFGPAATQAMSSPDRIAALIDLMEDIDERQDGQPGGVPINDSPISHALLREGSAIVEPLLDAIDHDHRLTRSYSFGRNFFPPRHLISVADAAETLLERYFGLHTFRWTDPAKRRAWLLRNKDKRPAERFFDLLADDSNDDIQWLDAAEQLTDAFAEEARRFANPSLSELLAKRALEMKTNWSLHLGMMLYHWDPTASLPVLEELSKQHYAADDYFRYVCVALRQLGKDCPKQ